MKFYFKACPVCAGDAADDGYGDIRCLMCGRRVSEKEAA